MAGESLITIQQGDPVVVESEVTFLGIGSAGDRDACRRMTFPDSASALLPDLVYSTFGLCSNPDRTFNLDNDVLSHPITDAVLTLGGTRVVRFETELSDQIVVEVWTGSDRKASAVTALFRQFYDYLINSSILASDEFITWEPRYRNAFTYQIELLSLTVGGGQGERRFDVQDFRDVGGLSAGGTIENALDGANVLPTGYIDREMELRFRIVGKV